MRITAIEPQRRSAERVNIHVDGQFCCGVALEVVQARGMRVGEEIDEATIEGLVRDDDAWKAREAALSLLAYRARSREELRRRLTRKGFEPGIVDATLERLEESGLLDDRGFAGAFVRDRVRFGVRGPRRMVEELRARGVGAEVARETIDDVMRAESLSETDLARKAAEAWARRGARGRKLLGKAEEPDAARRRLFAYLTRRGFAPGTAMAVAEETLRRGVD